MRWEQLFADLEARFEIEELAAQEGEAASRTRAEAGRIRLVDRLRGALGHPVVVTCRGAGDVRGRVTDVGVDWLLVTDDQRREHLVASAGVRAVAGLGRETGVPVAGAVARAWDLRRCVRALARDRATVRCVLDDGSTLAGTVDRVGADFLELAEHPLDEPRRRSAVRQVRVVALDAVAVLVGESPVLD